MGNDRIALPLILGLGLLLRLLVLINGPIIEMDGVVYAAMGELFTEGNFTGAMKGVFPPVYPLALALFHLVIPDAETAGRLVSLSFGLSLIILAYYLYKYVLEERRLALWGAFFVAIHPQLIRCSGQVLTESLATFLFTLTILLFYRGWIENRGVLILLSSLSLSLTYLTRPEYIVYYIPFVFLLLLRKRPVSVLYLLLPFIVFGLTYVLYMRAQTGLWIISMKAIQALPANEAGGSFSNLLPPLDVVRTFMNLPFVVFHLFEALTIPFFILALFSWRSLRLKQHLTALVCLLLAVHVVSLALITSSTKRFSTEFVPLLLLFSTQGFAVFDDLLRKYRRRLQIAAAALLLITLVSLYDSAVFPSKAREMQRAAGYFLLRTDPSSTITSRLPIPAYYSRSTWINAAALNPAGKSCGELREMMRAKGIKYVVVDEEMGSEARLMIQCGSDFNAAWQFGSRRQFVRIYRVRDE